MKTHKSNAFDIWQGDRAKMASPRTIKVCLLGDTGVGKSSLALRFTSDRFEPYSESTIGASFMSREVEIIDGAYDSTKEDAEGAAAVSSDDMILDQLQGRPERKKEPKKRTRALEPPRHKITFNIWDTAGQERYHSLAPMYYRGADIAILVYDICRTESFDTLQRWVKELEEKGPRDIVQAVCGNKSDLKEHRQVEEAAAKAFAEGIGALYIEASACDSTNVFDLFVEAAKQLSHKSGDESDASDNDNIIDLRSNEEKKSWLSWC